jgi:SAM-dependent methyltransferase
VQAVLEHVLSPAEVVAEIHRVLKPGGLVYAETPFMQQVHEGAWDFTRFTDSGHRWLFRGFTLIDSGTVLGAGTALVWSVRYAVAAVFRSRLVGTLAGVAVFWLRFVDRISGRAHGLDAASGVYFMGAKASEAIGPKEAVAYYRGAGR